MKKTTIMTLCLAACFAAADTKITWLADVTADRAETVTGVQSGQVANAAAHIVRTDNPHGVTAPQIGALTNETDEAAFAAMPFNLFDATKNVIWKGAGTNANTTQSILIGDRAGNAVTGSTIIAIGRDAAREIARPGAIDPEAELSIIAIGENAAEQAGGMLGFAYNIAIGDSAFKEGAGHSSIAIGQDALDKSPGAFTSIAIGREAGRTAAAEHMIAIGYQAGEQAGLTNSVVIGANAGRRASGQNLLVIDSSGNNDSDYPARAMIYGNANDLTLGRIDSNNNVLRGNWLFNNDQILTNETDEAALAALAAYAAYWPPNATASSWFTFVTNSGAITITGYNIAGGTDVAIPDYINGLPVTEIEDNAFYESGVTSIGGAGNVVTVGDYAFMGCASLTSVSLPQVQTVGADVFFYCTSLPSVSLPQVQTVGDNAFYHCTSLTSVSLPQAQTVRSYAFYECASLTSVSLPQAQTVEGYAFYECASLTSVSLPQVQTVEGYAFYECASLTSVSLPQVQTVGAFAFDNCSSLTSLYFDSDAPTIENAIFNEIPANQVTNYVTNPQATGWGATLGGMPVVRLPLYADAITLNGDTITEWPVGGGETSIIAPLYDSGTNVTVTSTQRVYSVAVTGAGPVGIDWSGLALDGTGRAEVTLRLNVTEWAGTNVTFSPSLIFDRTPEILVTGVWEFACSTIDGTTTRVMQTWPEATSCWMPAHYAAGSAQGWVAATNSSIDFQMPMGCGLVIYRVRARGASATPVTANIGYSSMESPTGAMVQTAYPQYLFDNGAKWFVLAIPFADYTPPNNNAVQGAVMRIAKYGEGQTATTQFTVYFRTSNANERAAYAAGWRP